MFGLSLQINSCLHLHKLFAVEFNVQWQKISPTEYLAHFPMICNKNCNMRQNSIKINLKAYNCFSSVYFNTFKVYSMDHLLAGKKYDGSMNLF